MNTIHLQQKQKVSVLGGKSNKKSKSDYVGKKDAGARGRRLLQTETT